MRRILITATTIALALSALPAAADRPAPAERGSPGTEHAPGEPDVDVRGERRGPPPSVRQRQAAAGLDGATIRWNEQLGVPATIMVDGGYLTGPSLAEPEAIARRFLVDHAEVYGLSRREIAGLRLSRAIETPDVGSHHLSFRQTLGGVDVHQAVLNVTIDRDGRIVLLAGPLHPGLEAPARHPRLDAEEAIRAAAATVGAEATTPELRRLPAGPRGQQRFRNDFAPDLGDPHPVTAEQVIFPDPDGTSRAGWRTVVETGLDGLYDAVVDAATGELLSRRNRVDASHPQGNVFREQHPLIPGAAQQLTSFAGASHNDNGWVDDNTTQGNNAIVFHDPGGTGDPDHDDSYMPTTPAQGEPDYQHFDYTFTDALWQSGLVNGVPGQDGTDILTDRDAVVTQAFYYVNMLHDRYYAHGFTEEAGNFQEDNFGRGGEDGDPVLVRVDFNFDNGECCNAFMATPGDGQSPRLTLLVGLWQGLDQNGNLWPGALPRNRNMHRAMNGDTVTHEWVHGLTNRLVGDGNLGSGTQTGALGEGWSDAYANSLWNDPVYGGYNNDNFATGIRGVSYADNDLVYSDLCQMHWQGCQVHTDGRIWATTMWDQFTYLTDRHGLDDGTFIHERLMTHGLMNTPTRPSYLDARDGILAADQTNFDGDHRCGIWVAMAEREMGVDATSVNNSSNVTAGTDLPDDCVPQADAGGPYTTDEGSTVALDATGSDVAAHHSGGETLSFEWDLTGDGEFDDATGATPTFGPVGDDGTYPVAVRVTNEAGASDVASTVVEVANVDPSVTIDDDQPTTIAEGDTVTVTAHYSDPGWLDTHTATIDWGTPAGDTSVGTVTVTDPGGPGPVEGTVTGSFTYGDTSRDGTFTVEVTVTDDDGGQDTDSFELTVVNVAPTVTIGLDEAVDLHGGTTIVTTVGEETTVEGRATDPGSDDLTLEWDWADGTTTSTTSLNDPAIGPDPFPSPEVNPRDVTDTRTHTWDDACLYELGLTATDDDGGTGSVTATVIVVGDADARRTSGYWHQQFRPGGGNRDLSPDQQDCYLAIVGHASAVFHDEVDASTAALATGVLHPRGRPDDHQHLDRQLLTAWLNFANGAIGLDELVDTTDDGVADTAYHEVLEAAEAVRLDPDATSAQLEAAKDLLEAINLGEA